MIVNVGIWKGWKIPCLRLPGSYTRLIPNPMKGSIYMIACTVHQWYLGCFQKAPWLVPFTFLWTMPVWFHLRVQKETGSTGFKHKRELTIRSFDWSSEVPEFFSFDRERIKVNRSFSHPSPLRLYASHTSTQFSSILSASVYNSFHTDSYLPHRRKENSFSATAE